LANLITISRFPLLLIYLLMLYLGNESVRLISVPLLFIALMFDSLDGIVARRTGNVSLSGSVLDIAADRVYELVLWVSFADLKLIPVAIPLIVITRTTLTDAIRSLGVKDGKAPFDQHETKLGTFIVGSRWMRLVYGLAKIISFCGLTVAIALAGYPEGSASFAAASGVLKTFQATSWIAVAFCVVRGSPVILGAIKRSLRKAEKTT
jgi:phosphatidylglycerophosphate synthase